MPLSLGLPFTDTYINPSFSVFHPFGTLTTSFELFEEEDAGKDGVVVGGDGVVGGGNDDDEDEDDDEESEDAETSGDNSIISLL